jgi:hypothetical protein
MLEQPEDIQSKEQLLLINNNKSLISRDLNSEINTNGRIMNNIQDIK